MPTDFISSFASGLAATAPKAATPAQAKAFTGGVDKAQADFNKSLANAKNTLAQANKQGNKVVAASARALIDQLNTVVKPALAILQKAQNPNAQYTGDTTTINKALGGGAPGSGPSGVVLGSGGATGGKGAYSLEQIRAYMDANNGEFPPDLNTIASGITASDLTNLVNQYESGGFSSTVNPVINSATPSDSLNASFSIVEGILKNYDMKGVADSIAKIRRDYPEIASDDILSLLKFDTRYNAPYLERFAGNKILMDKGLPTLDDAMYLKAENEYQKIFKAYGVDSLSSRTTYATLIGNRMDAADVTDRIKIGYERLKADKYVEEAFRQFYPSISQGDIVAAMLNPLEMKDALERKATAAEIAGSAAAQGLSTSQARAEELVAFGIDKTKAQTGYRYAAQALPRGTMLSQISPEEGISYNQQLVEDIKFKQNVAAQEKEQRLIDKEINRYKAQPGNIGSKSFASQARGAGLI